MKIKRIAHLGIAVKDLDAPKKLYTENLGLKLGGEEVVEAQKVKVSFIQVGESNLELLLPTAADSPVAKFLENKGEGFHHLALEVEDIHAAVEERKRSLLQARASYSASLSEEILAGKELERSKTKD